MIDTLLNETKAVSLTAVILEDSYWLPANKILLEFFDFRRMTAVSGYMGEWIID